MNFQPFYQSRQLDDSVAVKAGFNPYYPEIQSGLSDPILIERKQFINLASNNYLGLSNDSRLKEAAINAIRKYGVSMCATPVASGYSDLFRKAEESLTEFTGLEDSLIFPSCYQANNGIFKAIAHPDDIIIFDRFSHSSLIEGIRVAGCANRPFRHNDLGHLDSILKHSTQFGPRPAACGIPAADTYERPQEPGTVSSRGSEKADQLERADDQRPVLVELQPEHFTRRAG